MVNDPEIGSLVMWEQQRVRSMIAFYAELVAPPPPSWEQMWEQYGTLETYGYADFISDGVLDAYMEFFRVLIRGLPFRGQHVFMVGDTSVGKTMPIHLLAPFLPGRCLGPGHEKYLFPSFSAATRYVVWDEFGTNQVQATFMNGLLGGGSWLLPRPANAGPPTYEKTTNVPFLFMSNAFPVYKAVASQTQAAIESRLKFFQCVRDRVPATAPQPERLLRTFLSWCDPVWCERNEGRNKEFLF